MPVIKTFPFNKVGFDEFSKLEHGQNWPVVYLIEDGKEIYIGETINIHSRSKQHLENEKRKSLTKIHVISDDEYNKSATLDTEALLIQYIFADGQYTLQNGNGGLQNHNYFDKQKYISKFEVLWSKLQELKLTKQDLVQLKNTDLFKYSPYKTLTEDQLVVVSDIVERIVKNNNKTFIVNGKPGTGKTILATYLFKYLAEDERTKHLKVGLVVPMTSLRLTLQRVFRKIKGLKSNMIIGPSDVVKSSYDILIIDEAHRLKRRKNITNYRSHDQVNLKLELGNEGTELDWILKSSQHQIFLFDENQSVRPADIRAGDMKALPALHYELKTQMRVEGGERYMQFVEQLFEKPTSNSVDFEKYDFKVYEDISEMVRDIKEKETQHKLSRIVAGYAWPWVTKKDYSLHDIEIGSVKLKWNSTNQDWVNSKNAINEVGCIHTIQGYDLNYVGVIIGPELSYNFDTKKFFIKKEHYHDANGWRGIEDPKELERYIINIYKTLLTRGIKGTYIYAVDENVRKFLKLLHK